MSSKSRRDAHTSRRRLSMAAGALLAGAAIPIAAAGSAWADETSDKSGNTQPPIPITTAGTASADVSFATGTTQNPTETLSQLEAQGLSAADAKAVVTAEGNGTAVDVSYHGITVVDDNQGATTSTEATAQSGSSDVAAAIGAGSSATDVTGDAKDNAFANGAGSTSNIVDATYSTANSSGGGSASVDNSAGTGTFSYDVATANGAGSQVIVKSVNGGSGNVTHDVATASGGGHAAVVQVGGAGSLSYDTATANGGNAGFNGGTGSGNLTHSVATVSGGGFAEINSGGSGTVTDDAAHASNGGTAFIESGGSGAFTHDTVTSVGGLSVTQVLADEHGTLSVSYDTATATNGGNATVLDENGSTVAVTHDTVSANNGQVSVLDAGSSSATAVNTGSSLAASVEYATDSTAKAQGAGSTAEVTGTSDSYIINSHAADNDGTSIVVTTSDITESNSPPVHGAVAPEVSIPLP